MPHNKDDLLPKLGRNPIDFLSVDEADAALKVRDHTADLLQKGDAVMDDPNNMNVLMAGHCSHGSQGCK